MVPRRAALLTGVRCLAALGLLLAAGGCVALGWTFGPGFSCRDPQLFQEPPVVLRRGSLYALQWTYGQAGFYFHPTYEAREGKLLFTLQGTSSSGSLAGRRGELPIEGAEELAALQSGGAFWWGPDGELARLELRAEKSPLLPPGPVTPAR